VTSGDWWFAIIVSENHFLLLLLFLLFRRSLALLDFYCLPTLSSSLVNTMRSTMASRRGERMSLALILSYVFDWVVIMYMLPLLVHPLRNALNGSLLTIG
jgi:hypothetical protein